MSRFRIWELSTPSERAHLELLNPTIIFEIGFSYLWLQGGKVNALGLGLELG